MWCFCVVSWVIGDFCHKMIDDIFHAHTHKQRNKNEYRPIFLNKTPPQNTTLDTVPHTFRPSTLWEYSHIHTNNLSNLSIQCASIHCHSPNGIPKESVVQWSKCILSLFLGTCCPHLVQQTHNDLMYGDGLIFV